MLNEIRTSNSKLQDKILYFEELRGFINLFAKQDVDAALDTGACVGNENNKENLVSIITTQTSQTINGKVSLFRVLNT